MSVSGYECGTGRGAYRERSSRCHKAQVLNLKERIKRLEDCIEGAWCLIANVSQGDWKLQHLHWQESVAQWMEKEMYPIYKEISKRKAKEAKP
jgi:hypothetical protein